MIAQRELDRAVLQPWTVYQAPADVIVDSRLSDGQKRRILESWEHDARELAVAQQEKMGGGERSQLHRVLDALAELPGEDGRPRGPATVHGSRPRSSAAAPTGGGQRLTAQQARQGEIILRTPARKAVFIGGLVLAAIVCVLLFYQAAV